jgi:hypothetical protein
MGYDSPAGPAVFSIIAIGCAIAVFIGFNPLLAIAGMAAATIGAAMGEGLARVAVLVSIVALFAAFFLPSALWMATI